MRYIDFRFDINDAGLNDEEKEKGPLFCLAQVALMTLGTKSLKRDDLRIHAKIQQKLQAIASLRLEVGDKFQYLELSEDEYEYLQTAIDQHQFHSASAQLAVHLLDALAGASREEPEEETLTESLLQKPVEDKE